MEKLAMFFQVNKAVIVEVGLALFGAILGGAAVALVRKSGQEVGAVDPASQWQNEGESRNDTVE